MERPRRGPVWLGIDVACVLVFCAVGRRSHDEGLNVAGIASTAWPFLSGTAVGWLAVAGLASADSGVSHRGRGVAVHGRRRDAAA